MTENKTPKVYAAIHNVLTALQVSKGGMLPGNMGGKAYMTAEDISNEVKRLFVENRLILRANETVAHVSTDDLGDKKMRFQITISGTYEAIHIDDGSALEFSGTGQGLATGTAVAANIASTFALKNALQRQFLISEASVDAEGHTEQAPPKQNPAQQAAQATKPKSSGAAKAVGDEEQRQAQIRISEGITAGTYDKDRVTALHNALEKETGKDKSKLMVELEKRLKSGEVA